MNNNALIKTKRLKLHFVIYSDIIGVSHTFETFKNDYKKLDIEVGKLTHTFEETLSYLIETPKSFKGSVKVLSDNCIFSIPLKEDDNQFRHGSREIGISLEYIGLFQYILAIKNYFLKGGAAIGLLSISDMIVMGPVLEVVGNIEKNSIYPSIFLDKSVIEILNKLLTNDIYKLTNLSSWILKDNKGNFFINYLFSVININPFNYSQNEERIDNYNYFECYPHCKIEILNHKNNIQNKLQIEKVMTKFVWLGHYHNYFCNNYFQGYPELVIHNEKLNQNYPKFFEFTSIL